MPNFIYVNILNEGMIPWVFQKGPIFGYYTSQQMYDVLCRDPRVKVEIATPENIRQRKAEYEKKYGKPFDKSAEKETPHETVSVNDSIMITPIPVKSAEEPTAVITDEKSEEDEELDQILDAVSLKAEMNTVIPEDHTETVKETPKFKKYKEEELSKMTRSELKQILLDRGYKRGPYGPKQPDRKEVLIEKILITQKYN